MTKENKYGDNNIYESFADSKLFLPLAKLLVDPLRYIGMTPNRITYMSIIFTLLSILNLITQYTNINNSIILYLLGYLFDCIDGMMARKYDMVSYYGMALDPVSDNIAFLLLFVTLLYKTNITTSSVIVIIIFSYLLSISYGLNEAISNYKKHNNDNFYLSYKELLKDKDGLLYKIFLFIMKQSYSSYHVFFPTYDSNKINTYLKYLKEFNPGNYIIIIVIILSKLKYKSTSTSI